MQGDGTVVQWLATSPHIMKVLGSIPTVMSLRRVFYEYSGFHDKDTVFVVCFFGEELRQSRAARGFLAPDVPEGAASRERLRRHAVTLHLASGSLCCSETGDTVRSSTRNNQAALHKYNYHGIKNQMGLSPKLVTSRLETL
ncbi:unnamed protein product [Pleuronectes platessa]|uniref:Uncharacterized protein n=1 Tax=Pleuronectes platessa TaxID=8262 RepID=A0A9N7US51_PLEPL|nr:unnamed protein product [Pleuronectes platessa]